jgi:ankyrin repeat protein
MTAKYCGSACQRGDRQVHKQVCKVLGDARNNAVLTLVVAAGRGDVAKVTSLLEEGSKVDKAHGEHGITALYAAAEYGNRACAAAVVTALLRAGASIDKTESTGRTPLHMAAHRGHEAVVVLLLQAGADVNKATANTSIVVSCTALSLAGGGGHVAVVALLLQAGALVDKADDYGATPLSTAAGCGHVAVVDLLLQAGACVNSADKDGSTPLMFAAQEGHEAVVAALLRAWPVVDMAKGQPSHLLPRPVNLTLNTSASAPLFIHRTKLARPLIINLNPKPQTLNPKS